MREGVYLGAQGRIAENILGTEQGIFRARTIRRLPVGKTWDAELVTKVQAGVAQYISGEDEEETAGIAVRVSGGGLQPPEAREFRPRSLRLRESDFLEHGYVA